MDSFPPTLFQLLLLLFFLWLGLRLFTIFHGFWQGFWTALFFRWLIVPKLPGAQVKSRWGIARWMVLLFVALLLVALLSSKC